MGNALFLCRLMAPIFWFEFSVLISGMCVVDIKVLPTRCSKDRELNQARSKPDPVHRPVRAARTIVHHYNSKQRQFFLNIPLPLEIPVQEQDSEPTYQTYNLYNRRTFIEPVIMWATLLLKVGYPSYLRCSQVDVRMQPTSCWLCQKG